MSSRSNNLFKIIHFQKYLALFLIALGIPTIIFDDSQGAEMPLLVGLFILMISPQKIQDERVVQIKMTSLYLAFIVAYAVKLLTSNLFDHAMLSFQLVEINHFLILILALTNIIFYARLYIKL